MDRIHQKMIDAIIRKAERVCPDSLLLIGIYGSAATGDIHPKSDLDLLILIGDERGWQLADGFILEDTGIGYDLYCTDWNMLEADAQCNHAHLTRLLDAKIVYVKDQSAVFRLDELRKNARGILASDERTQKAMAAFYSAKALFAECFLADSLSQVRTSAGAVIHNLLDAVMLYNGQYFHLGVKRTFEEVAALCLPFDMEKLVMTVISGENEAEIRSALTNLMCSIQEYFTAPAAKEKPSADNLKGTYEEMFSNWRNKMGEAADGGDMFSSFMNMVSFQFMLNEISAGVDIPTLDVLSGYDPGNLQKNAEIFDLVLAQYREEYRKARLDSKVFPDIEAFLSQY